MSSFEITQSSNKFSSLVRLSFDSFVEVVLYLSPRDLLSLATSCREFRACFQEHKLWWMLCRYRIVGLRPHIDYNESYLDSVRDLIGAQTYRDLFIGLHSLQHSLFGWFRLIPFSPEFCQGGLYHIFPADGQVRCYRTNELGDYATDDRSFSLRLSPQSHRLEAVNYTEREILPMKVTAGGLRLIHEDSSIEHPNSPEFNDLVPLPWFFGPSLKQQIDSYAYILPAIGLFGARYGSHGTEILQVSIHRQPDSTCIPNEGDVQFGSVQLQGLKITGDPNVPANQFSFCINLDQTVDIPSVFAEDTRPIIMFPSEQAAPPVIMTWQDRLPRMKVWAKGYGQINRHPPVWDPEWVKCNFILYDKPIGQQQACFSILWDDETDYFRHAMDFVSLPTELVAMAMQTSPFVPN